MSGNSTNASGGFPPHVMDQLQQAAQQVPNAQYGRDRGRGRGGRGQGRRPPPTPNFVTPQQGNGFQPPPPGLDSFPPLGSQERVPQVQSRPHSQITQRQPQQFPVQPRMQTYPRQVEPREFFDRARGGYRGRQHDMRSMQPGHGGRQYQVPANDNYQRPPVQHSHLYHPGPAPLPNSWAGFPSPGHELRHRVMAQSDYLNELQAQARAAHQLKQEESVMKENFRRKLELFFQETLAKTYHDIDVSEVRLKCYGSLNNGFGLADCDMDLLLALPKGYSLKGFSHNGDEQIDKLGKDDVVPPQDEANTASIVPASSEEMYELGWLLEDGLLGVEIGARLLTNTRVPIMKVCEKPDEDLLQKMRQYAKESRQPSSPKDLEGGTRKAKYPPVLDMAAIETALSELEDSDSAAQVTIPESPQKVTGASIEFAGDNGIKCDINFSNFVALKNTQLLKKYCSYDPRVAEVGVFVKTWAKLRDINTPYWGTLSSYGYVLLVLHYLMNIVSPPVIPNLQQMARDEDAWVPDEEVPRFEDKFDVRFLADSEKLAEYKNKAPRNRESTGHLIRGFFWYYSAKEGFNYKLDIVSIRTQGGILRKQAKGWTEAKWAEGNKNVRQRYLLAIEDPFETEHNVARVVGHNGIVATRDEFRRAWDIISKIGSAQAVGQELLAQVEGRGDLLRKDQEHHRQKMRQMRQMVEEKERELRENPVQDSGPVEENGMWNENNFSNSLPSSMSSNLRRSSNTMLTSDVGAYQDYQRQSKHGRYRAVKDESDNESDDGNEADDEGATKADAPESEAEIATDGEIDRREPRMSQSIGLDDDEPEPDSEPLCNPDEIMKKHGLDAHGNLIAWDISTQDGRWLHWRDGKIRKRTWSGVVQPLWATLDRMCPYDSRRPIPEGIQEQKEAHQFMNVIHPPVPLNKLQDINSADKAIAAGVIKPWHAQQQAQHSPEGSLGSAAKQLLPSSEEPVGLPIAWDKSTAGGRWLKRRDSWLRLGTYTGNGRGGKYAKLHRRFPYDATMSNARLDELNALLRAHYRCTTFPVNEGGRPMEKPHAQAEDVHFDDSESFITNPSRSYEPSDLPVTESTKNAQAESSAVQGNSTSTESKSGVTSTVDSAGLDEMPDQAFLRSRRLAFFAQQEAAQVEKTRVEKRNKENIKGLMKDAGIEPHTANLVKNDSGISGIFVDDDARDLLQVPDGWKEPWSYGDQPWSKRPQVRRIAQSDDGVNATESSGNQVSDHSQSTFKSSGATTAVDLTSKIEPPDTPKAATTHVVQVPDTLYPGVHRNERPKDEDPNIMPIPRKIGFEFDIRQLRDLAIIKEGGNGCTREGFEYEVEEDYELGSGGEMAVRQSLGNKTTSAGNDNEVYDYGRGDEEGLLAELPDL